MLPTTKTCSHCKKTKTLSDFYKSKQTLDGLHYRCKLCKGLYAKEYRERNNKRVNEYGRKTYSKTKEKKNAYGKKYYKENKLKMNEWNNQYYADNKEAISARNREYHNSNKTNEEYNISKRNSSHKRRVLVRHSKDGTIPMNIYPLNKELIKLLEIQKFECYYCGSDLSEDKHLDHHVPISKGGTHSIDNVVWLCPTCNLSKSNKLPDKLLLI